MPAMRSALDFDLESRLLLLGQGEVSDQQTTTTVTTAQPAPPVVPARAVSPQEEALRQSAIEGLLLAVDNAARTAGSVTAAQDAQDWSRAALQLAQAAVILDPNLVAPQGVPPNAIHPPLPHIQMQQQPAPPAPQQGARGGQ